jgi:hypothetical protein
MAKKFLTGLNLVVLDADPATGSEGELYFNSSASVAKIYQAGAWSVLGAGGGASGELTGIDSIVYPDYITFDTTPENTSEESGTLSWDEDFETLKLQANDVTLQIGQEHIVRVKNGSGSTAIPNMRVVMFSGATGDTVEVSPALSTASYEPELLVGITTEEIPADGFGFVTQFGFVNKVDTSDWELGDLLYSDAANPGQLTNVKPSPPNWNFPIAAVTRVHVSTGRILVRAIPGKHLHDIVDVSITTPLDHQALIYNSSASVWSNADIVNSLYGTGSQIDVSANNGDITLSLPNELTTPGNLTVTGNLTVSGSTTYINTETLNIEDNIVTLNSNVTGSPVGSSGIEVERGTEENSYVLWNEFSQGWNFSHDIYTHAIRNEDIVEINVSASVGTSGEIDLLTAFAELNINSDGSIDLRPGDVSGFERYKFTNTHLEFPDLTQQDTAFLGMPSYNTGDLLEGTNLYFTDERAVTALDSTLSNYLTNSSASTIYLTQSDAGTTYLTQSGASSTYQPIGSYLTSETDPVFTASDAYGIISSDISNWNESYSWGNHASAGYALDSHNHTLDSLENVEIYDLADGDSIVWNSASSKWVNEVITGGSGNIVTVSSTAPTSPNIGDGWYDNTDGTYHVYDGTYWVEVTSVITMSDEEAQDKVSPLFDHANHVNITASYDDINNQIILTSSATPDLSAYLTASVASSTYQPIGSYLTPTTSEQVNITNTTEATNSTTGALIVSGGVGVAKDLWVDGNLHVAGTTTTENTKTVATHDNLIYLNAALDSEITGASGDGTYVTYIADNLYTVGMDIRVTGVDPSSFNISTGDLKTVYSATASSFVVESTVTDTYISGGISHAKEEANPDLGFAGGYYNAGYAHAGLFRDASDGVFKFFQGYTPEPDEAVNIDIFDPSFELADIAARGAEFTEDVHLLNINMSGSISNGNSSIDINNSSQIDILSKSSDELDFFKLTVSPYSISIDHADSTRTLMIGGNGLILNAEWAGDPIGYAYGGTGLTTLGTAGQILTVNTGATGLEWADASGGSSFTNSSELAGLLSDETGSGSLVFSNSPTITSPEISGGTINNTPIGATTASTGRFTSVNINGIALTETSTGTTSAASTFNTTVYSAAEYIIYASTSSGNYVSKVMMLARGSDTPIITEYAILTQGTAPSVTITPSYSAPNAVLTVAVTSGTNIEIIATEVSI